MKMFLQLTTRFIMGMIILSIPGFGAEKQEIIGPEPRKSPSLALATKEYKAFVFPILIKGYFCNAMDKHGILRRDELFPPSGLPNKASSFTGTEFLLTLSRDGKYFCSFMTENQCLTMCEVLSGETVRQYPLKVAKGKRFFNRDWRLHSDYLFYGVLEPSRQKRRIHTESQLWLLDLKSGNIKRISSENYYHAYLVSYPPLKDKGSEKNKSDIFFTTHCKKPNEEKQNVPHQSPLAHVVSHSPTILWRYCLETGETTKINEYSEDRLNIIMDEHDKPQIGIVGLMDLGKNITIYHITPKGALEPKFSSTAQERCDLKVDGITRDLKSIVLKDGRFTDFRYPVLRSLVGLRNPESPLLTEEEEQNIHADVKFTIMNPDHPNQYPVLRSLVGLRNPESPLLTEEEEQNIHADVKFTIMNPDHPNQLLAFAARQDRLRWHIRDDTHPISKAIQAMSDQAEKEGLGELLPIEASRDLTQILFQTKNTLGSIKYMVYDTLTEKTLFQYSPSLRLDRLRYKFSEVKSISFPARDGLTLQGYLTLPQNIKKRRSLPTVLYEHGGPHAQHKLQLDPVVQLLASRGYAVFQLNFRGSTGFGRSFRTSGDGEWGKKMLTDVIDARDWLVSGKIADPNRIGIVGASYGAFSVLSAMTQYPDYFACGVAVNGVYDLPLMVKEAEEESYRLRVDAVMQVGADPNSEEGRKKLEEVSPFFNLQRLKNPVLVFAGSDDTNCPEKDSYSMARKARRLGKSVTYIKFNKEGHTIMDEDNLKVLMAVSENFLASHLGGFAEPIGYTLKDALNAKVVNTSY